MGGGAEGAAENLVGAGEDICRLCFSASIPISYLKQYPNQIDPATGLLRLEELCWEDLKKSGFSVMRRHLYSCAEAIKEAERRDGQKSQKAGAEVNYQLAGTLIARVDNINAIEDGQGKQIFKVLETPLVVRPRFRRHLIVSIEDRRIYDQQTFHRRVQG